MKKWGSNGKKLLTTGRFYWSPMILDWNASNMWKKLPNLETNTEKLSSQMKLIFTVVIYRIRIGLTTGPISKGNGLIIVHAGGEMGFVNDALLICKSGTDSAPYIE
jgi:hypothetical protein